MIDRKLRAMRRGPFGIVSRPWVEALLRLKTPPAAVKVALVLAARVDATSHSTLLTEK